MPFVVLVLVIMFTYIGLDIGTEMGHSEACKSIKLEWVKDQKMCMKVTREEVK